MKYFQFLTLCVLAITFTACSDTNDIGPQAERSNPAITPRSNPPDIISLPIGFEAEGIEIGQGNDVYVTSIAYSPNPIFAGAIWKGDLSTGEGDILVQPTGVPTGGIKFDSRTNRLYVCKPYGAQVYHATTGELIGDYAFADPANSLVNDVIVTGGGAYFTDSFNPRIFRLPLGPNGQPNGAVEEIPLPDYDYVFDPTAFGINMNGIAASPNGQYLIVNNMTTGTLYRIDTEDSYATVPIDISNQDDIYFQFGDGLLLNDTILYVCQNFPNKIAVIDLNPDLSAGTFVKDIVSGSFHEPATIADKGSHLYAANAYFYDTFFLGIDPATQSMEIVKVSK